MQKFSQRIRLIGLSALLMLFTPLINLSLVSAKTDIDDNTEILQKLHLFANVFSIVRDNYVVDVEDKHLIEDALNGALESLDPHSHYVPKDDFQEQQKSSRREYGGLGIEVTLENGLVKVNYANPDAPAARAGIKSGDYITAVEGEKVLGKTLDQAVEGMRGLAGDPITVTVLSPNKAPRDITIIREVIQGRAVRHRVEQNVGYIFIETFNHPRLDKDFKHALETLQTEMGGKLPGLVIDLRGNRGGLLDQSVKISGFFLDGGEVLSARGREADDTERYNAERGGALQDRGRAIILGRRSFGKGSVQSVIPLQHSGGALRLTTQRYYTPSGISIQGRGILPDVLVAARPDTGEIRKRFREDSLPNALTNPDDTDYKEVHTKVDYPPEDWPADEDYQLRQAVTLLKSSRYKTLITAQNKR